MKIFGDIHGQFIDLLHMFKETLGVDDGDFKRDAYLQLARFGTNLMAQPGGSLTAAIGRAAEKPLEGVGEIISAKIHEWKINSVERYSKFLTDNEFTSAFIQVNSNLATTSMYYQYR